jgi:hypothetical protein
MPDDALFCPPPADSQHSGPAQVQPNTITVYSDIGCPWASLALFSLRRAINLTTNAGMAGRRPVIEHRAFPLELFNRRGTPKPILDAEIAVIASTEPALSWSPWRRPASEYPVTMLPALEAVQATRKPDIGGARGADQLDAALRRSFYVDSSNISLFTEIVAIAEECPDVDADRLQWELRRGTHREVIHEHFAISSGNAVQGSPHLFLPDGRNIHNPGVRFEWTAAHGHGFPVILEYQPSVWADIVAAALEPNNDVS